MNATPQKTFLLDIPLKRWFPANLETLLVVVLLALAIVSRFYDLGARTVSHDEVNHVVPTYDLYSGRGYRYDPMSHGPLQFHMMALSVALFGDNDFTARIPAAVLSVVTIALAVFAFRRYLGRTGAVLAGLFLLISPIMLFYGRYARNEAYIMVWDLLTLYSILRYLEKGEGWALALFTFANAIHFTDKATSYMLAGLEFIFLVGYLVDRLARREWENTNRRKSFLLGLMLAVILAAGAVGIYISEKPLVSLTIKIVVGLLAAGGVGSLVWAMVEAVRGLGWAVLRSERSLDLAILIGTFVLPLAGAIPLTLLKFSPADYSTTGTIRILVAAGVLAAIGAGVGIWWFGRKWLVQAALFFTPFILLYSTFFTSPQSLLTGLVGTFSYWSNQQAVARGGQPWYYYLFLQIPMYEFLPALGTIAAIVIVSIKKLWQSRSEEPFTRPAGDDKQPAVPVMALLIFWVVANLALFTYAGEKMPQETMYILLPMILATAWAVGWLIETIPWKRLASWTARNYVRLVTLVFFGLLAVVTGRTAFRAAYINYNNAFEYLVYAHAAADPKMLFEQIEELSLRTTGGTDMVVAYDNNARYPYWWYMRHFTNKIDFDVNPTRTLRDVLVIAGSDSTLSKLQPVVRDNYYQSTYNRLWWPNMDYWSLKWQTIAGERSSALGANAGPMNVFGYIKYAWPHIKPFFTNPAVRQAVWEIWFNADYTDWAALKNSAAYTIDNWNTVERMYFFVRKDITAKLWPYGATAQPLTEPVDPYETITTPVTLNQTFGSTGSMPGQYQSPRAVALALDGSLYVADSLNHRIQHISPTGEVLQTWGSFANVADGNAPGGTFNEPWGIAVGPDGSVYVADTWNYRIQKFTPEGVFISMWGSGPSDGQGMFYGPRGLAVDPLGRLFVADTGNKRIVIYDADGNYLTEFGTPGMSLNQLDEPVALAFDSAGNVYITDTWNQRVEVFTPDESGLFYSAVLEWPVDGWYGNSLNNKPYITVDAAGNVYVTDPEQCRVIGFSPTGQPVHLWDGCDTGSFNLPTGIVSDGLGGLWVVNAGSGTLIHFETGLASPLETVSPTESVSQTEVVTPTETSNP